MQIIPITNDASQIFTVILNNQLMRVSFWYQTIGSGWYMTLEFANSTKVVQGTRINSNSPVLQNKLTAFEGDIIAVPNESPVTEPGRNAWNSTHSLVYLTPEELEDLGFATV